MTLEPPPPNVLLVEDDAKLARLIDEYLVDRGYRVTHLSDGSSAVREIRMGSYDVVILDVMLPGKSGLDVCRSVRSESDVPILFLTARAEESDRVLGLELGGDDYVTKPFSPRELAARLTALIRRSRQSAQPKGMILRHAGIELDRERRSASRNGKVLELTTREFDLLRVLMERPGRALRREHLVELIHGSAEETFDRSIDVAVHRLRQKLDDTDATLLKSVRGVGYLLGGEHR